MPDIKCKYCGSYNNIREVVTMCLECNNNLFNQKTNKMNVFKKGDRVFIHNLGWCEYFKPNADYKSTVYKDNAFYEVSNDFISFTEYRLEGFTQERPFEPEIGKLYWFWDDGDLEWKTVVYSVYKGFGHKDFPYKCQIESNFQNISDKNPLENDSE